VSILDEMVTNKVQVYTIQNYSNDEVKAVNAAESKLSMR
jgi:hypothetical protein